MLSCHSDLKLHDSLKISFKALLKQGLWVLSHRLCIETTENLSCDFRKPFSHRWIYLSERKPKCYSTVIPLLEDYLFFSSSLKCLPYHVHSYSKIQPQIFTLNQELIDTYIYIYSCMRANYIYSFTKQTLMQAERIQHYSPGLNNP